MDLIFRRMRAPRVVHGGRWTRTRAQCHDQGAWRSRVLRNVGLWMDVDVVVVANVGAASASGGRSRNAVHGVSRALAEKDEGHRTSLLFVTGQSWPFSEL